MANSTTSSVLPPVKVYGFQHGNSPSSEALHYQNNMNNKQIQLNKQHSGGSSNIIVPQPTNSGAMVTSPTGHDNLVKGATNMLNAHAQAQYDHVGFPDKKGGTIKNVPNLKKFGCLSGGLKTIKKRKPKRRKSRKPKKTKSRKPKRSKSRKTKRTKSRKSKKNKSRKKKK